MFETKTTRGRISTFIVYCACYTIIACTFRLEDRQFSASELLFTVFEILCFMFIAFIFQLKTSTDQYTRLASVENMRLASYDTLTGLYNYEECHRQLETLLNKKMKLAVVLMDCNDLKSMNSSKGFQGGNRLLQQIAQLLKVMFPDALLIARYGGDEFLLALPVNELSSIHRQLDSAFPNLTGIQLTYGMAVYGIDGYGKDELLLVAEKKKLYDQKRELQLKEKEHLHRSEKLRVVGELASGMAHEIRNPLTTIKGFLQLSKVNGYNVENWYQLIMLEIQRMSELTAEFLQFSKPHVTHFKEQPLQQITQRVVSLMETEAARLGHQIILEQPEEPVRILMDGDKMVQLFLNLIKKNAIEAMKQEGTVSIQLYTSQTQGIIKLTDTGLGIPQDQLDKIFHPFYTTKESGTGLGLSICHKIVQDHNGTMEVHSTVNEGTTFVISLPIYGPRNKLKNRLSYRQHPLPREWISPS